MIASGHSESLRRLSGLGGGAVVAPLPSRKPKSTLTLIGVDLSLAHQYVADVLGQPCENMTDNEYYCL